MPDHPDTTTAADAGRLQPILAGIVAALVGFTSSFAVVLTGLRAVGATPTEAASDVASHSMWRRPVG
ncbi:hypothetical protein BJI47_06585 [Rhodococcus sp. 1168]|nr:hypothetical protein BJI47_06585 [Rhodococcus sp. 1168]